MVQKGQSFLWPGMRENKDVTITDVGTGEPGEGAFGDPMGEGRVELSRTPPSLSGENVVGASDVYELDTIRDEINPREIQKNRSETARITDAAKAAPVTDDPLEWASDPSAFDFEGVDTPGDGLPFGHR